MNRNVVPAVDKAMSLLDVIAAARNGITLPDLIESIKLPRSTVYRVLNTLAAHDMVVRNPSSGLYRLGPKISDLNAQLPSDGNRARLIDIATPLMEVAATRLEEACKLTVRERDHALTISAVSSASEYALTVRPGHTAPLYAGGAGKVLLAYADAADIARIAGSALQAFTPYTITDAETLAETLRDVRARGYAEDAGELRTGVHSVAAPVFSAIGDVVAAISVPFVGTPAPDRMRLLRQVCLETAAAVSKALGYRSSI